MQLNFKTIFLLIISWFLIVSCERPLETDLVLPKATPFVTFYLTDISDTLKLFFKKPISANDSGVIIDEYHNSLNITDALVLIDDGLVQRQMHYDSSYRSYLIDTNAMPLLKGREYHISVTQLDGTRMEASTVIPAYDVPSINYTALKQEKNYTYDFSFNDAIGEEKYYLLQFSQLMPENDGDTVEVVLKSFPILKQENQDYIDMVVNFTLPNHFYTPAKEEINYGLLIRPYVINKDMFLYFNSINSNLSATGNPYSSPSPVYSNFTGGRGIFGPVISK